jgi:hypothetical protein
VIGNARHELEAGFLQPVRVKQKKWRNPVSRFDPPRLPAGQVLIRSYSLALFTTSAPLVAAQMYTFGARPAAA